MPAESEKPSRWKWLVPGTLAASALFACVCLVPILALGGYALWPSAPKADKAVAIKKEGKPPAGEPPAGETPATPNDPAPATPRALSMHRYWSCRMTEGGIEKIITSIRQLPIEKKALLLRAAGDFITVDEAPSIGPDGRNHEVFMLCQDFAGTGAEIGFFPGTVRPPRLASRALAIHLLGEGLDTACASDGW
jgi:hypothetical protein